MPGFGKFKLGLVQMAVGADKAANLVRAASLVKEAASNGAQVIALPVCLFASLVWPAPYLFAWLSLTNHSYCQNGRCLLKLSAIQNTAQVTLR